MSNIDIPIKPANEVRDVVLKSILNDIVIRIDEAIEEDSFSVYYRMENDDNAVEKITEILTAKGYRIEATDNSYGGGAKDLVISW